MACGALASIRVETRPSSAERPPPSPRPRTDVVARIARNKQLALERLAAKARLAGPVEVPLLRTPLPPRKGLPGWDPSRSPSPPALLLVALRYFLRLARLPAPPFPDVVLQSI